MQNGRGQRRGPHIPTTQPPLLTVLGRHNWIPNIVHNECMSAEISKSEKRNWIKNQIRSLLYDNVFLKMLAIELRFTILPRLISVSHQIRVPEENFVKNQVTYGIKQEAY